MSALLQHWLTLLYDNTLLLQAVAHGSPLVRSAAQAGLSDLPPPTLHSLTLTQQRRVWQWVWHACQRDEAAAVRAAGAKCLGSIAGGVPVEEYISGGQPQVLLG